MNKCPHCKQIMPTTAQLLGQKIKAVRESSGITQLGLAKCLNIDETQIARYEKGKSNMSIERVKEIAEALGLSVSALTEDI